jgi:hypothetical protein
MIKTRAVWAAVALFAAQAAWAIDIESVRLLVDNEGEPGEEVGAFLPGDHVQHFLIKLDGLEVGNHDFKVEFWAVDTTAGGNIKVADFAQNSLITNEITAQVSLPRDWPQGAYRLDVLMDGERVASHDYAVRANAR